MLVGRCLPAFWILLAGPGDCEFFATRLACHARLHCASSFDAPWIVGQLAVLMQVRAQSTFQNRVKCRAPGIQTSNIMLSEAMLARCFTLVQLFYIQRCSSCVGPKCLRWCHFLLA